MSLKEQADSLLRKATDAGDVPGVVAMATESRRRRLRRRVRRTRRSAAAPMTPDTVVLDRVDDEGGHRRGGDAAGRAGQAVARRPGEGGVRDLGAAQVLDGFDDDGAPGCAPPKRTSRSATSSPIPSGFVYDIWSPTMGATCDATASRASPPARTPPGAAAPVRPGRALGLRHRHRLGGQDGRGRQRSASSATTCGRTSSSRSAWRTPASRSRPTCASASPKSTSAARTAARADRVRAARRSRSSRWAAAASTRPSGDYGGFVRMILNRGTDDGNQLLKPETVDLMSRNQMGDIRVTMLKTDDGAASRTTPSSSPACRRAGA